MTGPVQRTTLHSTPVEPRSRFRRFWRPWRGRYAPIGRNTDTRKLVSVTFREILIRKYFQHGQKRSGDHVVCISSLQHNKLDTIDFVTVFDGVRRVCVVSLDASCSLTHSSLENSRRDVEPISSFGNHRRKTVKERIMFERRAVHELRCVFRDVHVTPHVIWERQGPSQAVVQKFDAEESQF